MRKFVEKLSRWKKLQELRLSLKFEMKKTSKSEKLSELIKMFQTHSSKKLCWVLTAEYQKFDYEEWTTKRP